MSSGLFMLAINHGAKEVKNLGIEYYTYKSDRLKPIEISNETEPKPDIIIPEYLELNFFDSNNIDSNNIYLDNIKKMILKMMINSSTILELPLALLLNLNKPIYCDNKLYINLCFDFLFGEIKIQGLKSSKVIFELVGNLENVFYYGITSKLKFLDTDERKAVRDLPHKTVVQQITIYEEIKDNPTNFFVLNKLPFGKLKGLFIECENVDHINKISIDFAYVVVNYDIFLLKTKCKKLNNNMIYLPFNDDKSYTERTIESFEGYFNFSRLDFNKISIYLDSNVNYIKMYGLEINFFMQNEGIGKLAYFPSEHSMNNLIYKEKDEKCKNILEKEKKKI